MIVGPLSALAQSKFATYACNDGSEFVVAFFEGDRFAHVQLDGQAIAMPKRPSISGSRYVKGDVTLTIAKSGGVTLKRGKRSTQCSGG
jgi:membrane-bound inhibitor of C-type lysozyme